jgi:phosphate-selective porin OprO/OprP
LIDTGNLAFADMVSTYALEAAGFYGPVGFQAEYAQMDVSQNAGRPDLSFDGAYASANWFITGESRVYDPRTGVFTRLSPKVNVAPSSGTWGAWEIAGRWSTLNLDSDPGRFTGATLLGVRGGEETNYTLGVNWYWNPYFRMMLNYVTADVDNRANTPLASGGALEGGEFNTLALRVQQEW